MKFVAATLAALLPLSACAEAETPQADPAKTVASEPKISPSIPLSVKEARRGPVHVPEPRGVGQKVAQGGGEIGCRLARADPAPRQDAADDLRQAGRWFVGNSLRGLQIAGIAGSALAPDAPNQK